MPRKRYQVVLDPSVVEDVKKQLGDTSFSRFTERALEAALGGTHPVREVGNSPLVEPASRPASPRASARFFCPVAGCTFSTTSSKAVCGVHARTVVDSGVTPS